MHQYKAPLRDMKFLLHEVFDYDKHYAELPGGEEFTPDIVDAVLEEMARFCESEIAPLNQSGDEEGCKLEDGKVTTPKGFKEAYQEFKEAGWPSLSHPPEYGGQGMPMSLGLIKHEIIATANWSWSMYPGLSIGAMNTLFLHGTEEQKDLYLKPLVSGEWMGTMCLTESHCGTDLGQMKTRAEPQADGTYKLTGTKIFISSGDHDMTDNIVHIVLARLPDAPPGIKGISLFIVPKVHVNADGSLGEPNNVSVGSLEKKMGIKASATCVMNFDGATAYMLGKPNKGMEAMFTFMNTARIGTGIQGIAHTELSFQGALAYAKDRRSMRSLSGKKEPEKPADALIYHADVRRMLLTQKAIAEGGRAMLYFAAKYADKMVSGDEEAWKIFDDKLGFLTPIIKGFLTELGYEAANHGMQVFGGHGYIHEWGMEQIVRDARIATLYEGTTGIQALDLLGRKVIIMSRGKAVPEFTGEILKFCAAHNPVTGSRRRRVLRRYVTALSSLAVKWNWLTGRVLLNARNDRDAVGAAAYDFLMFSGYVTMGYFWAQILEKAYEKLEQGGNEPAEFYKAKIRTAEFYLERILPRNEAHAEAISAGPRSTMSLDKDHFVFD
nr:acyl-CoA dehydrogenase C-terminal domain-containing protein [Oceanococcus sp. HetDA_MAG_MS8]